jgi:cytochrome c-type biogenesis protein CcmH
MKQRRSLFLLLAVVALIAAVWTSMLLVKAGQQPLDQHVHAVAAQLKCPVCQNESVADSPSWVAQQMRAVIRQQIQAGRSDQEIIQYFEQRYGNGIVWMPQWQGFGLLTWLVPVALLLVGASLVFFTLRDWQALAPYTSTISSHAEPEKESKQTKAEDVELDLYRKQLINELADEDPLFEHYRTQYSSTGKYERRGDGNAL